MLEPVSPCFFCGLEKVNKWEDMKRVFLEPTMSFKSFLHCSLGAVWNGINLFLSKKNMFYQYYGILPISGSLVFQAIWNVVGCNLPQIIWGQFYLSPCWRLDVGVAKEKRRKTEEKLEHQPPPSQSQPPEPTAQCSASNWDEHFKVVGIPYSRLDDHPQYKEFRPWLRWIMKRRFIIGSLPGGLRPPKEDSTLPPIIMVRSKMVPSNSSYLSNITIFHFRDYGRKSSLNLYWIFCLFQWHPS